MIPRLPIATPMGPRPRASGSRLLAALSRRAPFARIPAPRALRSALTAAPALALALAAGPAAAADMSADEIARRLSMQRAPAAHAHASVPQGGSRGATLGAPRPQAPAMLRAAGAEAKIDLEILFAPGSAALDPGARRQLAALCAALRADLGAGARIYQIIGHTDAVGDARMNLILSQSRADGVTAWLAGPDCGIDRRRLSPVGMGERRLKIPDDPEAAANRRVEIQSLS